MTLASKLTLVLFAMLTLSACASKGPARVAFMEDANPVITEEEAEARAKGEVPTYDISIVRNEKVESWMNYFQGRGRKWFKVWLERSGRYIPMMRRILKEHGMPEDLVYLAMIESGFSSRAYSRAKAVGTWQFIRSTGRLYGLQQNFWKDERRDPEKATIAAARHLKDLYDQFQSWKLAAAAYNAGSGKVSRAIRKYKTEDFWELTKGRYLKPETKHYVPKIIAAALIAKEPAKYGFVGIEYQEPLSYEKVLLDEPVNLQALADKAGVSLTELMDLNPELNHPVTPPESSPYELRVPARTSSQFITAYKSMDDSEKLNYTAHLVRKGDTLGGIAKRYGIPSGEIMKFNKLSSAKRLKPGNHLLIPVPQGMSVKTFAKKDWKKHNPKLLNARETAEKEKSGKIEEQSTETASAEERDSQKKTLATQKAMGEITNRRVHTVRAGESLWTISQRYGVPVRSIKEENNLRRSKLYPGRRLVIPTGA